MSERKVGDRWVEEQDGEEATVEIVAIIRDEGTTVEVTRKVMDEEE